MNPLKTALAYVLFSLGTAYASEANLIEGHQLRIAAFEKPDVNWITQEDVKTATKVTSASTQQPVMRLTLKPEAAERMRSLTGAHIGKRVRVTWDGKVISEPTVASAFGSPFEVPLPPL